MLYVMNEYERIGMIRKLKKLPMISELSPLSQRQQRKCKGMADEFGMASA